MKRKLKAIVCRNPEELATAMGLHPSQAIEWELRDNVTQKIIETFRKSGLTITGVAKKAQTSRARNTHILKANSFGISLDVLFRVLSAMGQKLIITYKKAA